MSAENYNKSTGAESGLDLGNILSEVTKTTNIGVKGERSFQGAMIAESRKMTPTWDNNGKKILPSYNPFYYDQQLSDKRLVVTLHPNAKYAGEVWVPFPDNECFSQSILLNKDIREENLQYRYRMKPIATAIASEDFIVNVNNSWTDFGKNSPIEDMFNSLKPYAPMISAAGPAIKEIMNYDYSKSDSTVVKGIGKFLGKVGSIAEEFGLDGGTDQLSNLLNRQLTVQGTRFSYFSGSNTSFGNLSMKFTVFSDWVWNGNEYAFTTCYEQLEELYDYAMCKYEDVNGSTGGRVADKIGTAIFDSTTGKNIGDATEKFIETNFKWQMPPGGFRADLRSIDNVQKGTLKLRINDMYTLENLVITSMNVSYSRIPCKCPLEVDAGKIVPLYADVVISLQPATLYSDTAMRAFTEGRSFEKVTKEEVARKKAAEASAGDDLIKKIKKLEGLSDE